jgi:hypothetical protein
VERLLTGAVAIGAAVALAIVLALVGRSVNRPPVVAAIEAKPAVVARDGTALLHVRAEDPDADALQYEFKAESGTVVAEAGRPHDAKYSPAAKGPVADRVSVTVTDARGLATTASTGITIEGLPAEPTPTPEPTLPPTPAPTVATPKPLAMPRAIPTALPRTPTRPPTTPAPVVPQRVNRPPILHEGTTISELGENPIVLVATGSEPDGEPVTFSWDFGPCLQGQNPSQFEAEVKLIGECSYAVASLTWTDPQGASATAQWTLNR